MRNQAGNTTNLGPVCHSANEAWGNKGQSVCHTEQFQSQIPLAREQRAHRAQASHSQAGLWSSLVIVSSFRCGSEADWTSSPVLSVLL